MQATTNEAGTRAVEMQAARRARVQQVRSRVAAGLCVDCGVNPCQISLRCVPCWQPGPAEQAALVAQRASDREALIQCTERAASLGFRIGARVVRNRTVTDRALAHRARGCCGYGYVVKIRGDHARVRWVHGHHRRDIHSWIKWASLTALEN